MKRGEIVQTRIFLRISRLEIFYAVLALRSFEVFMFSNGCASLSSKLSRGSLTVTLAKNTFERNPVSGA